jgi:hypothetical protein
MIGTRATLSAVATVVGLMVVTGPRVADPALAIGAERLVRVRAEAAVDALDALRVAVQPGLDQARRAAAAVLTADRGAGDRLDTAGVTIAGADPAAIVARRAWDGLNGARAAWRTGLAPLPDPIPRGELASIGDQLRVAAPAADAFVDMRLRALGLPAALAEAVTALERGDTDTAAGIVDEARADLALLDGWERAPATLPVWIGTSDAMIGTVDDLISATRAGDAVAAAVAAEAFAALADEAPTADRALRIALGEGGSALTAAPLERLAAALGGIEEARATAAAMAAAGPSR